MGIVLAKFRKEKTTYEILEKLEADIKKIEEYSIATQTRQKRFVGNFLVISIGLYIACFLIFYFAFFPPTWTERLSYSVPLLIFPLIIFFLRRFLAWFFQRKINSNAKKLNEFQAKKKEILEKVMDNETYKVALSLLTRFGDGRTSTLRTATIAPTVNLPTPVQSSTALTPNKKLIPIKPQPPVTPVSINPRINNSLINTAPASGLRYRNAPLSPPQMAFPNNRSPNNNMASMPGWRVQQQMRPRTPFPIMNQQNKGVLEKMVDYIIGDGPQNRFAMICKQCFGHNGMALEEEYEYMTFRCVYCNFLNPSKKSRPVGPKLPVYQHQSMNDSLLLKRKGSEDSLASTDETNQESEDNQNINESEKEEETIFDQKKEKDETEMESAPATAYTPLTAEAGAKVDNTKTRKQSHQVQSPVNIGINTIHLVLTTKGAHPALSAWALHQRQVATASETPGPRSQAAMFLISSLITRHHPSLSSKSSRLRGRSRSLWDEIQC